MTLDLHLYRVIHVKYQALSPLKLRHISPNVSAATVMIDAGTQLSRLDLPSLINWTVSISALGLLDGSFHFHLYLGCA